MSTPRTLLGLAYLMLGAALTVAFALLALGLMSPVLATDDEPVPGVIIVGVLGLCTALVAGVAMVPAVRRVEGVATESMLGVAFSGGSPGPASTGPDRWRCAAWLWCHLVAGAAFVAALTVLPALALEVTGWLVVPAIIAAIIAALAVGEVLARMLRRLAPVLLGPSLHERIARLEGEARELGERNRIARELHDSVGHALSLVTVQAAAARRVQETDPAFVTEALTAIEVVGRSATAELDHALGLLRADSAPRSAAPRLEDLPDLVAATSRAGLGTTLHTQLAPDDLATLSPVIAGELYRTAQEGLANAIRHGDAPCRVVLERGGRGIRLRITNAIGAEHRPSRPGRPGRGGRGVPGIVERARAIGGDAHVGVVDGQWSVDVSAPWLGSR